MWGQKIRQLHTGSGTAVSPSFSAVCRQTGQDLNTTHKMKSFFLQKFEETKLVRKSPKFDPAPVTLIVPPPSSIFQLFFAKPHQLQNVSGPFAFIFL